VNIVVVFSSQKDAVNIRNLLVRRGHTVVAVCTSGAAVNQAIDQMEGSDGIVISGYKYQDTTYAELLADLPDTYQMIVMASPGYLNHIVEYNVVKIPMPVKTYDLLMTLETIETTILRRRKKRREKPKERSSAEKALIEHAKSLLMQTKNMKEDEAHRYMQQCSMHNGTNIVETAQMLIDIYAG
jgi:response regulator NasT